MRKGSRSDAVALDLVAGDGDVLDLARLHLRHELAELAAAVSFFWIWAKCQARKMTTRSDIHNMTVLNVAFTVQVLPGRATIR